MGREYILSAQTLPIEEESAWFTGHLFLFCRHLVRRLILAFLSSVRCACR